MKKPATLLLSIGMITALTLTGCAGDQKPTVTPSDTQVSDVQVSSVEEIKHIDVTEAVQICIDHELNEEIFILEYNWYGSKFVSDDSLNKTMLDHYAPKYHYAPRVAQGASLSFVCNPAEELPDVIKLTQYGNTVRADSGLPYDTNDIELVKEGENTYRFTLDYRSFKMYYYLLQCEWQNGNTLKIAFAVEKPKN